MPRKIFPKNYSLMIYILYIINDISSLYINLISPLDIYSLHINVIQRVVQCMLVMYLGSRCHRDKTTLPFQDKTTHYSCTVALAAGSWFTTCNVPAICQNPSVKQRI